MRVRKSRRSRERGAAIFESMAALTVLCLLFFALLQIFYWCIQTQFCEYAAFYASKSVALGYRPNFCLRAARVAAISISGPRRGRTNLSEKEGAELYMTEGDASGVYYDYWYPQRSTAPELRSLPEPARWRAARSSLKTPRCSKRCSPISPGSS